MRVLLDTDIVLDLFLDRPPFADAAAAIWLAHERGELVAFVAAITPVNLYYIARKLRGDELARRAVIELLAALPVCPVDMAVLNTALATPFRDYEDAVQHACATAAGLETIITRNGGDYTAATLPIIDPANFVAHHRLVLS